MEKGLTKNQIISELTRSPHGKLNEYVPIVQKAGELDPEFLAHLIAWNQNKGQIRDSKVALPIVSLSVNKFPAELLDNSLAHIAILGPRELLKAYKFSLDMKSGIGKKVERIVRKYLVDSEQDKKGWNYLAVQHRKTLKSLYGMSHQKPASWVDRILFKEDYPAGSIFEKIAHLKDMSPTEAAGTIMQMRVPFLVARGALGSKAKEPDLVLALIERMSPTELITNVKMLEDLGVKTNPALRGAFDKALEKASQSKKNVLKTTCAAEQIDDEQLKTKLRGVQDKQLAAISVEGDWLILCDKSGSMSTALEIARQVAATLAKMAKGKVWLVFFDTSPQTIDVTGASLDVIRKATEYIRAGGGTSIGCGLKRMYDEGVEVDGIVVVSDAQENTPPFFATTYGAYATKYSKEVPVYLYRCENESNYYQDKDLKASMAGAGYDLQEFDLRGKVDFYSIPNLVATMRTNRYSLIDEIMAVPLLTLDKVFKSDRKEVAIHA